MRYSKILLVLSYKLFCFLLAVTDIGPRYLVHPDRVVEAWLYEKAAVPVSDHGDTAIPLTAEPGRVLRVDLHLKSFQAAFLRVIHCAFHWFPLHCRFFC